MVLIVRGRYGIVGTRLPHDRLRGVVATVLHDIPRDRTAFRGSLIRGPTGNEELENGTEQVRLCHRQVNICI